MMDAADDARQKLLAMLAEQNGAEAREFEVVDGAVLRGKKPFMSWKEACGKIAGDAVVGHAGAKKHGGRGNSVGVQFVDLDVDAETGLVHVKRVVAIQACGQVVCRKTAESQVIGGVIQGLSYALFENRILDRNVGAMVNPNLEMYKIIGTADMPHIEPVLWSKPGSEKLGVKAIGEPPTVPTAGAVACAVFNAIGRPVRDLPLTPDRVLAAMTAGEGGAA